MTPPGAPSLLHADALERRFGDTIVLRGASLRVEPGECHLVVGANGAGKTTLLRLLAGLARPSRGTVRVLGDDLRHHPERRRTLGLLSHQSHLYDDLTATENLVFAARLYGLADADGAARRQLLRLGLGAAADRPVRSLSRGMSQRVAIGRAVLHDPALLLLDEPFTGLDARASAEVTGLLAGQVGQGRALVLVSHGVHESWELATHVHLLAGGVWAESGPRTGTVDAFLRRYRETTHG